MRHTLKGDIDMLVAGRAKMVSEISALTFVWATFAKSNGFDKCLDIHKKKENLNSEKSCKKNERMNINTVDIFSRSLKLL